MHLVNNAAEVGDQGEALPTCYYINFKSRRVLMCAGKENEADAVSRGFKKVTKNHFVKFLDGAHKGFRKKAKVKK